MFLMCDNVGSWPGEIWGGCWRAAGCVDGGEGRVYRVYCHTAVTLTVIGGGGTAHSAGSVAFDFITSVEKCKVICI